MSARLRFEVAHHLLAEVGRPELRRLRPPRQPWCRRSGPPFGSVGCRLVQRGMVLKLQCGGVLPPGWETDRGWIVYQSKCSGHKRSGSRVPGQVHKGTGQLELRPWQQQQARVSVPQTSLHIVPTALFLLGCTRDPGTYYSLYCDVHGHCHVHCGTSPGLPRGEVKLN